MKKTTLMMMIASTSILFAQPALDNNNQAKKGMIIMTKTPVIVPVIKGQGNAVNQKMMMNKCKTIINAEQTTINKMQKKMMKQKMQVNSPFLIKHGLPHLSKMIMPYMNDPAFNLTSEQKGQLAKVRTTTMTAIMEAKPKVMALRKEIVRSSQAGVSPEKLKDQVAELALLQAAATMTHLKCIEATKAILTKDQMYFLLTNKNKKMTHGKKGMMRQKPMMMKRQHSGKCGQGMNK